MIRGFVSTDPPALAAGASQLHRADGEANDLGHRKARFARSHIERNSEKIAASLGIAMYRGISEFGAALAALVDSVPGAYSAVLSDEVGETVDYVFHQGTISALDLQLYAAQLASVLNSLEAHPYFGGRTIVLEAERSCLVTRAIDQTLRITLIAQPVCNLAAAFEAFEEAAEAICRLERS